MKNQNDVDSRKQEFQNWAEENLKDESPEFRNRFATALAALDEEDIKKVVDYAKELADHNKAE